MNPRRKDEFVHSFELNEYIVSLAHAKVKEKLKKHHSGMELEILSEMSLFNVLNRLNSGGYSVYYAIEIGDLAHNIIDQVYKYFKDVPDCAMKYCYQIAEEIKEIIEGDPEGGDIECR